MSPYSTGFSRDERRGAFAHTLTDQVGPRAPPDLTPITVTLATAKQLSGLGYTTLWGLIKDRKLETVHVGRRRLIIFRSLEALLVPDARKPRLRRRGRPRKMDTLHLKDGSGLETATHQRGGRVDAPR